MEKLLMPFMEKSKSNKLMLRAQHHKIVQMPKNCRKIIISFYKITQNQFSHKQSY